MYNNIIVSTYICSYIKAIKLWLYYLIVNNHRTRIINIEIHVKNTILNWPYFVSTLCCDIHSTFFLDGIVRETSNQWIWACQCNKIRMHLVVTRQILLFYSLYLSGEDHKNDFLDYILVWLVLWCLLYICVLDILFSSNHNIHKSSCGLCFWTSDPLI